VGSPVVKDVVEDLEEYLENVDDLKSMLPPAPMNHVKYLRAGHAQMPFRNF